MASRGPAPLRRIHVVHGPDVPLHRPSTTRWCAAAAAEWDIEVALTQADDDAGVLRALEDVPDATGVLLAADAPAVLARAAELAGRPLIWLDLDTVGGPPPEVLVRAGVQTIRGRGMDGHRWAVRSLVERAAWPASTHAYGTDRDQVADLRLPEGDGPHPVAVLIHGGAWRANWDRDLMDAMGVDLARRGIATWNIEYRRVGDGGGWPESFDDVAAAIDALAAVDAPLDLGRVALVGHSAGGQFAAWAAARADAAVPPAIVVSLAGVLDLVDAARRGVYDNAVVGLMGGTPQEQPERYAQGSPAHRLPIGVDQLLIHGTADLADNVDMNRVYAERARAAGDAVELVELADVDHFAIIEPRSAAYLAIAQRLERWAGVA
jgi:acetyl esterase/lipase